jgi:hypothetical protein
MIHSVFREFDSTFQLEATVLMSPLMIVFGIMLFIAGHDLPGSKQGQKQNKKGFVTHEAFLLQALSAL